MRANPDQRKGNSTYLYFYGRENYLANPQVYQQAVKIFGFTVIGITPIGLLGKRGTPVCELLVTSWSNFGDVLPPIIGGAEALAKRCGTRLSKSVQLRKEQ